MGRIINREKSVIVACDVATIEKLRFLVNETYDVEGIGGYKLGAILVINYGLQKLVKEIRRITDLPIIYDHQKAMTDIPGLGENFVRAVKRAGVNALIGFPQSGPETEKKWIEACQKEGLEVIIGGEMTHQKYRTSEGGYINDDALDTMYLLASKLEVNNFVVPGTKKNSVVHYRNILDFVPDLTFFAPGFIAQGGFITDIAKVAGPKWHAIVGRGIYAAKNIRTAAISMTKQLI